MRRQTLLPRPNWQKKVEAKGLLIHTPEGKPYWNESACYIFSGEEIETLEKATAELYRLCVEAAGVVIDRGLWKEFQIPARYVDWVRQSWDADAPSVYGRFDLAWNGSGPPKLLEFNADTPTSLLEAAVIQWFWLEDRLADGLAMGWDQYNNIHELLIASWTEVGAMERVGKLHIAAMTDQAEDLMTAAYMLDVARQAGLEASIIDMTAIGYNHDRKIYIDQVNDPIDLIFKLYPWEWMLREEFGRQLPDAECLWVEPPWKMIMANKAMLPLLWELFPNHPNLLWAGWDAPSDRRFRYVKKPIFGREGANVTIFDASGGLITSAEGPYSEGPLSRHIFQEFYDLPRLQGNFPVLGSWVIGGEPAGLGIREDDGLITGNLSRFVPHAIEG